MPLSAHAIRLIMTHTFAQKELRKFHAQFVNSSNFVNAQAQCVGKADFEWDLCILDKSIEGTCKPISKDDAYLTVQPWQWHRILTEEMYPSYGCEPKTEVDFGKILKFASYFPDVMVNFKNEGHSYFASSAVALPPGNGIKTLMVSVKHLDSVQLYKAGYLETITGRWHDGPVAKIGGGVKLEQLYDTLRESGNFTHVGGTCTSVGVGGWMTLGGLSVESGRVLGLGVDNVRQFEVMLSSGDVVIADNLVNQDLFKAMLGGGSGFGLILSMVVQLGPGSQVQKYQFTFTDPTKVDISQWYLTLAKHVNPDRRWALVPILAQGNSGGRTGGTVNMTFLGSKEDAESSPVYKAFVALLDHEHNKHFTIYSHESWPTYSSFKYDTKLDRGWDEAMPPTFNWLVPTDFALKDPVETARFLREVDEKNMVVDGCDGMTFGYQFMGKYAENKYLSKFQSSGIQRREAAFLMVACNKEILKSLSNAWPNQTWSTNHYQLGEAELINRDFVEVTWGAELYKELLLTKMKYDPSNKIMCYYCVAWPPMSQKFKDILNTNPNYAKTSHIADAQIDISPYLKSFAPTV